jgi:formylglycine-generating enzyme required for sulfatase activity
MTARLGGIGSLAVVSLLAASAPGAPRTPENPPGMRTVGPGEYRPLYAASPAESVVPVNAFFLDVKPVTNADYLAFVRANPKWRRDRVSRLFADGGYLRHWAGPETLGAGTRPASPVTQVSWFAAKAYCAARAARLPTEREWELAALASETSPSGGKDPRWLAKILGFYSRPALGALGDTGQGKPNYWGIHDLHGLAWEWIHDFGASLVAADSREKGEGETLRFCGASGASARDPSDYASFMRVAFRSSLAADYTTLRLGFRCAKDRGESP